MEKYIEGNKAAWEEAFENRAPSWRAVAERLGWGTDDSIRKMHDRYLENN